MTIHYHGTPISPKSIFMETIGACYCVSFAAPGDLRKAHEYGQSVMMDNGAFSCWRRGIEIDWNKFYSWLDPWLDYPNTWGVPPDIIGGTEIQNRELLKQWPFEKNKGKPVWHLHESFNYLLDLINEYPNGICFGSSGEYSKVGSPEWHKRVYEAWNEIEKVYKRTPFIHMMRGLKVSKMGIYPFASCDSTDVARNHSNKNRPAKIMVENWDKFQCPSKLKRSKIVSFTCPICKIWHCDANGEFGECDECLMEFENTDYDIIYR